MLRIWTGFSGESILYSSILIFPPPLGIVSLNRPLVRAGSISSTFLDYCETLDIFKALKPDALGDAPMEKDPLLGEANPPRGEPTPPIAKDDCFFIFLLSISLISD